MYICTDIMSCVVSFLGKDYLSSFCDDPNQPGKIIIDSLKLRLVNKSMKLAFETYIDEIYNKRYVSIYGKVNNQCYDEKSWIERVKHMNQFYYEDCFNEMKNTEPCGYTHFLQIVRREKQKLKDLEIGSKEALIFRKIL